MACVAGLGLLAATHEAPQVATPTIETLYAPAVAMQQGALARGVVNPARRTARNARTSGVRGPNVVPPMRGSVHGNMPGCFFQ